jgi:hypothetical protein
VSTTHDVINELHATHERGRDHNDS